MDCRKGSMFGPYLILDITYSVCRDGSLCSLDTSKRKYCGSCPTDGGHHRSEYNGCVPSKSTTTTIRLHTQLQRKETTTTNNNVIHHTASGELLLWSQSFDSSFVSGHQCKSNQSLPGSLTNTITQQPPPDQDQHKQPNAKLRCTTSFDPDTLKRISLNVVKSEHRIQQEQHGLSLEVLAMREIQQGEEIYIDYGKE